MSLKSPRAFSFFACASLTLLVGAAAQAQYDYYTVEDVRSCENQSSNTAIGAIGGALIGGLIGGLLDRGKPAGVIGGVVVGGVSGGIFGSEVSCHDQVVYVQNVDRYLQSAPPGGYRDEHCHVVVLGSGYSSTGQVCRTYHMDYLTPNGAWAAQESTACWVDGHWRHGYDADVIVEGRVVNPHPVLYYQVDDRIRDRQQIYWAGQSERDAWLARHHYDHVKWESEREQYRRERELRAIDDRQRARETVRQVQDERIRDRDERRHQIFVQ